MACPRILSVEDDPQTVAMLQRHYLKKGWPFQVSTGDDLFPLLASFKPTVVLMDWRLNGKQGHELVGELRRSNYRELPVIMVSGLLSPEAAEFGLASGADMYLRKPITPSEVDAHIESLLRRVCGTFANYDDGTLWIDLARREVRANGVRIELASTEWYLLNALLRSPDTVPKDELIRYIWGDANVAANALEKAVSRLKAALGNPINGLPYIENERGKGYFFRRKEPTRS